MNEKKIEVRYRKLYCKSGYLTIKRFFVCYVYFHVSKTTYPTNEHHCMHAELAVLSNLFDFHIYKHIWSWVDKQMIVSGISPADAPYCATIDIHRNGLYTKEDMIEFAKYFHHALTINDIDSWFFSWVAQKTLS